MRAGQGFIEFDLLMKADRALNMWVKMWRASSEKSELEDVSNYVFVRVVGLKLYLSVCTPAKGEYVLALFGDTLDKEFSWEKKHSGKKEDEDVNTKFLVRPFCTRTRRTHKRTRTFNNLPRFARSACECRSGAR